MFVDKNIRKSTIFRILQSIKNANKIKIQGKRKNVRKQTPVTRMTFQTADVRFVTT